MATQTQEDSSNPRLGAVLFLVAASLTVCRVHAIATFTLSQYDMC